MGKIRFALKPKNIKIHPLDSELIMKKLITTIALTMAVTSLTFAQGTVLFVTSILGADMALSLSSGQ